MQRESEQNQRFECDMHKQNVETKKEKKEAKKRKRVIIIMSTFFRT